MPITLWPRAGAFLALFAISSLPPQTGARAGTITFDDLSDSLTVDSSIPPSRIERQECTTSAFAESCIFMYSAPAGTVSAAGGTHFLNVLESPGGPISDVVSLTFFASGAGAGGTVDFTSDVEGGAVLDPVPGPFIVETGADPGAASVTWTLADGSTGVDTIQFASDVSDIPEPASAVLLGAGLLCLGLSLRGHCSTC